MEGEKQLLSDETVENHGIEAPSLVQEGITADEKHIQGNITNEVQSVPAQASTTEKKPYEEIQTDEIEVRFELQENKKQEENDDVRMRDNEDKRTSDDNLPGESTSVENGNRENVQTSLEPKKGSDNGVDSEKTQNTAGEKPNGGKSNEYKGPNGNHYVEVILDEGNNNVKNSEDSTKGRRARFSSEITIQPKAYFQAGVETVVMMPPDSTSDDVFQKESSQPQDPTSSTPHVVVNAKPAKPSDSVLPQTFFPLTVFSCLFCCPMIGLFAIYKSYSVKEFIKKGDIRKANEASQHARQLGLLTLVIGFFFVLTIIVIAVLVSKLTDT